MSHQEHSSFGPAGQAGRGRGARGNPRPTPNQPGDRGDSAPGDRGDSAPGDRSDSAPGDRSDSAPAPSDLVSLEAKIRELAKPRPMYTPSSVRATHSLRYDWTGWLSNGQPFPASTHDVIGSLRQLWHTDGLDLLDCRIRNDCAQILFEASHKVSPIVSTQRIKGRLQHALKQAGTPVGFSRKLAFRSLGENTRLVVERYLGKQVSKEGFMDPRFAARMKEYTIEKRGVDLRQPAETNSGRYWYNLHLVLVTSGRRWIVDYQRLAEKRDACLRVCRARGYPLKSLAVMPDHVHLAFRGDASATPEELALCFMNNLSFLLGRNRVWEDEYYVGTFSEYGVDVVKQLSDQSFAPATQGRRGRRSNKRGR